MAMSTTTKILAAAAVAGGVYFLATRKASAKPAAKTTMPSTGGGPPPTTGGGSGGTGKAPQAKPPTFPEGNVSSEKFWVDQIYGEWAGAYITADVAAIKNGTSNLDTVVTDLTDMAFVENYPTWADGPAKFPSNWSSSSAWTQWANAWNRMYTQMLDRVIPALSQHGV
jgi:hypothetical protein